jgi:hypothetical protein
MSAYKHTELLFANVLVSCVLAPCVLVSERNGASYSATVWRPEFFFSSFRTRQMYLDMEICQFLVCTHRITERKTSHEVAEA